jgi:hypothetical protein
MLLRIGTLLLAYVHTFPATKHLAAFAHSPSLSEAWKGFGALGAVCLYLLPLRSQVRLLRALWRRRRVLAALTWVLAATHAVPALDHLPRFLGAPSWGDGWRGIGSALAVAWFLAPVVTQGRVIAAVGRRAAAHETVRQVARVLGTAPSPKGHESPNTTFLSTESAVQGSRTT